MSISLLPDHTLRFMAELSALWQQIDQATSAWQHCSQLTCPEHCGNCCRYASIAVPMPELLPLAWELWQRGEADGYLLLLEQHPTEKVCVFYRPHPHKQEQGSCAGYVWRPSLCRLFGFAGRLNKWGQRQLNACEVHQQLKPALVQSLTKEVPPTWPLPLFGEYDLRIRSLDPHLDWQSLPINQALRAALQRIEFLCSFAPRH